MEKGSTWGQEGVAKERKTVLEAAESLTRSPAVDAFRKIMALRPIDPESQARTPESPEIAELRAKLENHPDVLLWRALDEAEKLLFRREQGSKE